MVLSCLVSAAEYCFKDLVEDNKSLLNPELFE